MNSWARATKMAAFLDIAVLYLLWTLFKAEYFKI